MHDRQTCSCRLFRGLPGFFDRSLKKGIITVINADERQWPEILRVAEDMVEFAGAEVVSLDLPLSQPATGLLVLLAESGRVLSLPGSAPVR
ncbi:MAG: hypothetical protein JXA44_06930 [Methanospirillaceae archaeon]|nr:hypothetical protein [Methanospirillaceae archaeon]